MKRLLSLAAMAAILTFGTVAPAMAQEHGGGRHHTIEKAAPANDPHAKPATDEHARPATDAHATPAADEHHAPAATGHEATSEHAAPGAHHEAEHDVTQEAFHTAENSSFVDLILKSMGYEKPHEGEEDHNAPQLKTIAMFQMPILSAVVIFLIMGVVVAGANKREMVPGKHQNLVELIIGGFDEFIQGIMGFEGRNFLPFLGTLFLYIWISNLIGLIPFFKAPTSSFNTTVALAIMVFLYVHWTGLRRNGLKGYLYHLAGEPKDANGWGLVPLLFPLHLIGELAKPMSLSLRLFGNIFGEETLIAFFVALGISAMAFLPVSPVGIPFQVPFMFLGLLTCTIQALVFTLLSTIYFALMLPHHDHEHGHGEHAAAHH